jgi:hypothetical protein
MRSSWIRRSTSSLLVLSFLLSATAAVAAEPSPFSDVQAGSALAQALSFLKEEGILQGYSDGTFRPNQPVKRAEAVKIIVASSPKVSADQLKALVTSPFSDVAAGVWYLPFVEAGRTILKIIDGPPKRPAFEGERAVQKVEFYKMLLLAQGIDSGSYGEIQLPLAADVTDPHAWFYPYLRYAIASSMTQVDAQGNLLPAQQLTRGDVAFALYHLLMYQQGRRTQALLNEAENELVNVLKALEQKELLFAQEAAARSQLAARGANASRANVPLVQGAVKITQAFGALVLGYQAGSEKRYDEAVAQSKSAWGLAEEAKKFGDDHILQLATQVQTIAKALADEARNLQARP